VTWLSERLAILLPERQQTVEGLARQLGIERSRLANIMSGAAVPNENLTRRLARYFGEDPDVWLTQSKGRADDPAPGDVPAGFIRLAAASELADGEMKIVFDNRVVIANAQGRFHAFGNICPHAAGPIGEGFLDGCVVECPWHAGQWDITSGKGLTPFATADILIFETRVVGDDVEVNLTPAVFAQGPPGDLQ
jgi:nitrite reductase/ring-hydroxylating ferredoxin subunit